MTSDESPSLDAIARSIRSRLGPGETVSFVSGNFNVVHPGHLRLFKFAAEISDRLVVGVNPDDHQGVAMPSALRVEGVRAIGMVGDAILLDAPPERFIAALRPEFVVKGKEFEGQDNPEEPVVAAYGGRLVFSSGEMRFSSGALLRREFTTMNFSAIRKPLEYPRRHGFTLFEIKASLARFSGMRVLVVGDLIIDDYITCEPLGMSQEDPTIVVSPIDTTTFVGGAGVVSAHARGLGAEVHFCSVVGEDEGAEFARASLEAQGVGIDLFPDSTRPTTRKQRFRAHNKTLLRVNDLRQHAASHEIQARMLAAIERRLPSTDVLLFSDFNYGCLPQALVDEVAERAARRGILMAADSQASSQLSDVSRFKRMTLITPTEREARLATQDSAAGLAYLSEHLCAKARARNVVITLGSEGMLVWGAKSGRYLADRLPAFNTLPKDPAGAGDSLFTGMAMALRAGVDIWQSAYIGAIAAACQVSRVGNSPLSLRDLTDEIDAPSYADQVDDPNG
ncbi:MAG: PfkB family carbohydrate kinase [Roseiarcus sp.]|jgi:rfaE bifunctional protein kinase chain/domain